MKISGLPVAIALCLGGVLRAEPRLYALDADASGVSFFYALNGDEFQGGMPVHSARIILDLANLSRSDVFTGLDASRARAGFILIKEALRGARVLETGLYPLISFQSTAFRREEGHAIVDGMITLRDTSHPIRLEARLFRRTRLSAEAGSEAQGALSVLLTGTVSRSVFGVNGYAAMAGDLIDLEIRIRLLPRE